MGTVRPDPEMLSVAVMKSLHRFPRRNWIRIMVGAPLLLAAVVVALLAAVPQVSQAQGAVPAQPTGLTAAPGDTQATLTWDDPSDSGITGYEYLQEKVAKLTASDGAADDHFGGSVSVDGHTAVVGAHGDNGAHGAAYVYMRQSGAWSQVAKLTASDGEAGDFFGFSVAVDGDTVVVGAIGDDDNGDGSGSAYVFTEPPNGWTTTSTAAKLTASDGADDDGFGWSVAVDGDTVVVGAYHNDDQGAAYLFTKPTSGWTTTSTAAKLTAHDGAASDAFGVSVAVDGDTVVVGAVWDNTNGSASGSAYVFSEPPNGWTTTSTAAKLTPSEGEDDDQFGYSVAVDGDTVVVGAYGDDENGESSGSAYVFTKPANGWTTTSTADKLTASDGTAYDQFGSSVAVEGDTVVVGAGWDGANGPQSGSAYLFTKPSGGWSDATETTDLTASDGAAGDFFGYSVAVDGDTVVVGAVYDGDNGDESGSAYVYEVSDWTDIPHSADGETNATSYTVTGLTNSAEYDFWIRATNSVGAGPASDAVTVTVGPPAQPTGLTAAGGDGQATLTWDDPSDASITGYDYLQAQVAKLTASDGEADDSFGDSVAVDGDTMVVGANRDDDNGQDSGSAYVFTRQAGTWSEVAKLTTSDGAFRDHFGESVAVDGDTVVVGALWDDDNGSDSGSAYVFTKPDDGWTTTSSFAAKLTPSDGAANDWFGSSVAVDGDTVVVGAHRDDGSGSAYVFIKPADGWTTTTSFTAKLTASDGAGGDRFGVSVAVDGDTVVAGASGDDDNGSNSGSGYVFTKPADGWTTTSSFAAKLTASDGAAEDHFGWVVAVDEDTAVVGAYGDDDNGDESGSAYVFTKPTDGWTTTSSFAAKLTASDGAADDWLGYSVAVDGDMVVVGAYRDHDNGPNSGSAYLFTKPATGWTSTSTAAKLTASDGVAGDHFGWAVAVDGDTVVVGAHGDDDKGSDSGAAYVYEVSDWTAIPNSGAGETNATSYTVTGLTNDAEYDFRIRAANSVGAGPASDTVHVTPTP